MTMTKDSLQADLANFANWPEWDREGVPAIYVAASFVKKLLPATCDACNLDQCEDCHGTGELWDEGLVEVVAKAMVPSWENLDEITRNIWRELARAVLAALTQEAGK